MYSMWWDAICNIYLILKLLSIPEKFLVLHQITILYCQACSQYQIAHYHLPTTLDCWEVPGERFNGQFLASPCYIIMQCAYYAMYGILRHLVIYGYEGIFYQSFHTRVILK